MATARIQLMIALSGIPLDDMVTVQMQVFYKDIVRRTAYRDMLSNVEIIYLFLLFPPCSQILSRSSAFPELRFLFVGT
jgi:hypothetical protein